MCPWYIRRKPCTYLASRLTLSPNRAKRGSIWASSPWSYIGCDLSNPKINTISKQTKANFHLTHVTFEFNLVRPKWFPSLLHVRHKRGTYLALWLALSPKKSKRGSIWPTSPRSSSGLPKWIYEPIVRLVQTVHLSNVLINTIPKRTKTSFHLTHVT
jgi:hypothetical protein